MLVGLIGGAAEVNLPSVAISDELNPDEHIIFDEYPVPLPYVSQGLQEHTPKAHLCPAATILEKFFHKPFISESEGREAWYSEARRLFQACARPNVMIKIPGTLEGLPAIETCLAEGINVNVTLLFSEARYVEVMEVWLRAMEQRADRGLPLDSVASVASFFVSRADGKVDKAIDARLEQLRPASDRARLSAQKSQAGIANSRRAYQSWIRTIRDNARFARLRDKGAAAQRPLWASTSTKNPSLPDIYYIEALAGPDTVNTVPPHTYEAYRDHGKPEARVEHDLEDASETLITLEEFGIDFFAICSDLEKEGVASFAASFETLLESIAHKRKQIDRTA